MSKKEKLASQVGKIITPWLFVNRKGEIKMLMRIEKEEDNSRGVNKPSEKPNRIAALRHAHLGSQQQTKEWHG